MPASRASDGHSQRMQPDMASERSYRSGGGIRIVAGYVLAIGCVLAAAGIRVAFQPLLGTQEPFVTFYLAVAVMAWFGDWVRSVLVIVLGGWMAVWFFMAPERTLVIERVSDAVALGLYVFVGLFITCVCAVLRRVSRSAASSAARAESERRTAEDESNRRRLAEADAADAHAALSRHQRNERLRLQAELESCRGELERQARLAALGQISARIAHDLRNTLGVIMNGLFLLKNNLKQNVPPDGQVLEMLETEARASAATISNLLASARPPAPQLTAVDLGEIVREIVAAHGDGDVRLTLTFEREPYEVWVDPLQFTQVLRNLYRNARDAKTGPLEIEVIASSNAEHDIITFCDNGPGIPAEIIPRLFEPFVSTKEKGAGLGLAMCRQIIARHGGQIRALAEVERGAQVRILLPVSPASGRRAAQTPSAAQAQLN